MPSIVPHALEGIGEQQPRVRDYFASAVAEGRLSHAYLFCGAPGAGMMDAAEAVAMCVVCPNGGDGTCGECIRVRHHTHPDVHLVEPGGTSGYLVEQVRDLVGDVVLTPMRASGKVYILNRAEQLRGSAANALLKTLEEPPSGVLFILIARSEDAVMPTIASRCQEIPFRSVPTDDAVRAVVRDAGVEPERARIALAITQTPEEARELLLSPTRLEVRRTVVRILGELPADDSWDVLCAARELLTACKAPLDDLRTAQAEEAELSADYLSPKAKREQSAAATRELSARGRSSMMEALAAAESFLRDVLLVCEGATDDIVNVDMADAVARLASGTDAAGVLAALAATRQAASDLARNVTPQLAFEVMLISVKEALTCQPSSR
jgi:DNA polymerase-3 subunit delta'